MWSVESVFSERQRMQKKKKNSDDDDLDRFMVRTDTKDTVTARKLQICCFSSSSFPLCVYKDATEKHIHCTFHDKNEQKKNVPGAFIFKICMRLNAAGESGEMQHGQKSLCSSSSSSSSISLVIRLVLVCRFWMCVYVCTPIGNRYKPNYRKYCGPTRTSLDSEVAEQGYNGER